MRLVLASILVAAGVASASGQTIRPFDQTSDGSGQLSYPGTPGEQLRNVRIALKSDGTFSMRIQANNPVWFSGKWQIGLGGVGGLGLGKTGSTVTIPRPGSMQTDTLRLEILDGYGDRGASGVGTVWLTRDNAQFDRIYVEGNTRGQRFTIDFRAKPNTSIPTQTGQTGPGTIGGTSGGVIIGGKILGNSTVFNATRNGTGSLAATNSFTEEIKRATILLRQDGTFEITVFAPLSQTFRGKWTAHGNRYDLKVAEAFGGKATGEGSFIASAVGSFDQLNMSGNAEGRNFNIRFQGR